MALLVCAGLRHTQTHTRVHTQIEATDRPRTRVSFRATIREMTPSNDQLGEHLRQQKPDEEEPPLKDETNREKKWLTSRNPTNGWTRLVSKTAQRR